MNNKKLGTQFEKDMCDILSAKGYWVHFIVPDARGAQPFDIIAVKNEKAIAIDCKTCVQEKFNISRLEDNQIMAFEKWLNVGNSEPIIAVEHKNGVYIIPYIDIKVQKSVKIANYGGIEQL